MNTASATDIPSRCDECVHMGPYGHGEPPDCHHPLKGDVGMYEFANPRGAPPVWCPLRAPAMLTEQMIAEAACAELGRRVKPTGAVTPRPVDVIARGTRRVFVHITLTARERAMALPEYVARFVDPAVGALANDIGTKPVQFHQAPPVKKPNEGAIAQDDGVSLRVLTGVLFNEDNWPEQFTVIDVLYSPA